jgi:hypothetical protein
LAWLLSFKSGISLALFFFRANFKARTVSPPAEVALAATISPMLAKQNGHIASPLVSGGEASPLSRLYMGDGRAAAISTSILEKKGG